MWSRLNLLSALQKIAMLMCFFFAGTPELKPIFVEPEKTYIC
jgi:hypothetical protein